MGNLRPPFDDFLKYKKGNCMIQIGGFKIEEQIYESVNGDYVRFCDRVNWPTYNSTTSPGKVKYTQQAPIGHLPSRSWVGGIQWVRHLDALSAKLTECDNNQPAKS